MGAVPRMTACAPSMVAAPRMVEAHSSSPKLRIQTRQACTGSGDTDRSQEGPGDVSNGKIAFQRFPVSGPPSYEELYVIDEGGTNETRLTNNPAGDEHPL